MTLRPQLDEDQMARMEVDLTVPFDMIAKRGAALLRAARMFRAMGSETMAKECEEALK